MSTPLAVQICEVRENAYRRRQQQCTAHLTCVCLTLYDLRIRLCSSRVVKPRTALTRGRNPAAAETQSLAARRGSRSMQCSGNGCNGCGSDSCAAGQGWQFDPNAGATPQVEAFRKDDGLTYLNSGGTEYVQTKCTHCDVFFWSRTDGPAMACCNLASCIQAAVAGLRIPDEPARGGTMDESDGDDAAAPEVAEETAPTPRPNNWGPEWKRKMRAKDVHA